MIIDFRVQNGKVFNYWKPLMHKATDRLVKELERTELLNIRIHWRTLEDGRLLNLHIQGFSTTLGDVVHVSRRVESQVYECSAKLDDFIGAFISSILHSLNTTLNEGVVHVE